MTFEVQDNRSSSARNPLDSTADDHGLTALRLVLGLIPLGSLATELAPSAADRQTKRAIRTLQTLVQDLQLRLDLSTWSPTPTEEELDAAFVRALRAAHETAEEEKREFIWHGLINGWVRTHGNPKRDRFQRLVSKYDLEHFKVLREMRSFVKDDIHWFSFESGSDALVACLNRKRDDLLPYLQEFAADGLVMIYDQPDIRQMSGNPSVSTRKIVLWKQDSDDLLNFIMDPRNIQNAPSAPDAQTE
ncbi:MULTISPECIES: hypothetical protein [Cryobacterium]|uniref:hypothetical protein n=1 Tax=Cryobacterium TaxID=69578 RepID=UPI000CD43DB1|nr:MULTISPECIES: hypothetical protein [Cryobacterium]POH66089.1 hypothetical protein C3B60_09710 [Cryobacterium zongtaii]TFC46756.1 hypothetical protein E3O57_05850 [Cryobacterium sp. TMN-39-2]